MKYAVPISFVFVNELSDRRIANARQLPGNLTLHADWIFQTRGKQDQTLERGGLKSWRKRYAFSLE